MALFGERPKRTIVKIEGMTCMHCAAAVERALKSVKGVKEARASLERKEAEITGTVDRSEMKKAVEAAGYRMLD
jgi:copper chaperone